MKKQIMTSYDKLELEAAIFHRMTGRMAPFKDSPAAAGPTDLEDRAERWIGWRMTFSPFLRAMHASLGEVFDESR